ncbi:SAM-dependent methyltransferase [Nocardia abscessus]|uniref:SAM-dependent methyltransferase n=1 Tax=Nocardia abscessus TaxID=120957 RepID=UPI002453A85E|nr:SAM-dependent methyltransferase [Nocardia abscessus]
MSEDRDVQRWVSPEFPSSARIRNYWSGGKDYYEVDRIVGDRCIEEYPDITTMAVQSRQFLIRSVRYLAEQGVRQFIDIGCGLPVIDNTHEVAQAVAAEAKVIYVDHDPLVLTHARALLTSTTAEGVVTYIDSDLHDPERIISDAKNVFDFRKPIAVMLMGVLGQVDDYVRLRWIVDTLMKAVPTGSYLAMWHGTDDSQYYKSMCHVYADQVGVPLVPRMRSDVEAVFDGLEIVDPGIVSITQWRTPEADVGEIRSISAYGAVARKP